MDEQDRKSAFQVGETVKVPYKELLDRYGHQELTLYVPDSPLLTAKIVGKDWGPNNRHQAGGGITFPAWFYHVSWQDRLSRITVSEETLMKWQR